METILIKKVQSLALLALQVNIPLIKIGIGIGTEKNIMEQLAPHALLDIIVLMVKAPLCAEIIIIKMKQGKQSVKPVQQELIAQIPQARHAQVVMENAPPAIKVQQTVQVAIADIIYQVQVVTLVLQMPAARAERADLAVIADIKFRVQLVCWISAQMVNISAEQAAVAVHLTQAATVIRFLVIADILGTGINVTKIAIGKTLGLVLRLKGNALQVGILHLVGQEHDVINLIGYVTRFHVILCLMSRALPSFFLFVIV